jgi:hypothetical protein
LNRTDADVTLFFLTTAGIYSQAINDPWFSARDELRTSGNSTSFYNAGRVSVLGCIEQHQFCNPAKSVCSNITSLSTPYSSAELLLNSQQESILRRLSSGIEASQIDSAISQQGSCALLIRRATLNDWNPIPDDQWMHEAENLFAISMTATQRHMLEYLTGPEDAMLRKDLMPLEEREAWMCNSQIVRRDGYTSFSTFGLIMVLVIGCAIILVGTCLETISERFWSSCDDASVKTLQWQLSSYLQLQRIAFEGKGEGTWAGQTNKVPTTDPGQLLKFPGLKLDSERLVLSAEIDCSASKETKGTTTQTHERAASFQIKSQKRRHSSKS